MDAETVENQGAAPGQHRRRRRRIGIRERRRCATITETRRLESRAARLAVSASHFNFGTRDGYQASGQGKPPAPVSHTYAKRGVFAAFLVVAQQQQYGVVQYYVPRNGLVVNVG